MKKTKKNLTRLERLNESLRKKGFHVREGQLRTYSNVDFALPADLRQRLDAYLDRGAGAAVALARDLGTYGHGEYLNRFSSIDFDAI